MIDYLVRSAICLFVLFAAYHFLLEKESVHRFNRFFLLFSLAFGLLVPLADLPSASPALFTATREAAGFAEMTTAQTVTVASPIEATVAVDYAAYVFVGYLLIGGLLLSRFLWRVLAIAKLIRRAPKIDYGSATIVLTANLKTPHSFLRYIFLDAEAYRERRVDGRVLRHELTHVRERHSLDIIVAELLKIVFWFNPVFIFYKKAIRLNHEFLADEAVIADENDPFAYQILLVQSVGVSAGSFTSNFNYSITKKRLIMMTKQTSPRRAMLATSAMLLIVLLAGFSFSGRKTTTIAPARSTTSDAPASSTENQDPNGIVSPDVYFKGATIWIRNTAGQYESKKYETMSSAEKAALLPVPPPIRSRHTPTAAQFKTWSNRAKYRVWDSDHWYTGYTEEGVDVTQLRPQDFVAYSTNPTNIPPHKSTNKTSKWIRYTSVLLITEQDYMKSFIAPRYEPNKELTLDTRRLEKGFYYRGKPVADPPPGVPATPVRRAP